MFVFVGRFLRGGGLSSSLLSSLPLSIRGLLCFFRGLRRPRGISSSEIISSSSCSSWATCSELTLPSSGSKSLSESRERSSSLIFCCWTTLPLRVTKGKREKKGWFHQKRKRKKEETNQFAFGVFLCNLDNGNCPTFWPKKINQKRAKQKKNN